MFPLALTHQWGWLIFIFFVVWLQCAALLADIQQRKALIESERQIKEAMEQFEKQSKGDLQ